MSIQSKFNTFNSLIHLSRESSEYSAAREKDDSITQAIKDKFKEEGFSVIEDFIQGSLKTFTTIRESGKNFDIDRAIVIRKEDAPDNPVEPKKVILELLEKRGFKNAKIKTPCVTADYMYNNLHIDIPVYRKSSTGAYQLAIGKLNSNENNREWSDSAPLELIDWVNSSDTYSTYKNEHLAQFRRLVRYIKRWRNIKFSEDVCRKIFSIGLTVMFKKDFKPNIDSEGFPNDLLALKATVDSIINYSNYFRQEKTDEWRINVYLPVTPYRDIFHGSSLNTGTQLRNKLLTLSSKLQQVIDETDENKQCSLLHGIFGNDFPEGTSSHHSNTTTSSNTSKEKFALAGAVGTSNGA